MQDSHNAAETDLSGLIWAEWRERLHGVAGEDGFAEPLGGQHSAVFIEKLPVLLVTFENFASIGESSDSGRPLGWQLTDALGWSHLCLVSNGDTWFRDHHVVGFFDRLIDDGFFDGFDRVIFYGAGSCGYAAAAFSVSSPGARVLALHPQATLDPRVTGWDSRFRHMRRTDFTSRFGYAPDMLDAAGHAHIVYDPEQALDTMHAALFTRPNVSKVRVRFFGLDPEATLLRLEVLDRILGQIAADKLSDRNLARLLRHRRTDPAYQSALLRHLEAAGRHRLIEMLCRHVLEQRNTRPFRKALRAARAGRQAEEASARGVDLASGPCPRDCVKPAGMSQSLTILRPDDWHLHLRDGAMLDAVCPESARHFGRAIIMPNLVPPVVTGAQAAAYRDRILAARPEDSGFTPLMTLYLTEETDANDVVQAHADGIVTAVKLYPAGATTNSASGVRDFERVRGVLEAMAGAGIPLCVHGEVTDAGIDIFDREAVFIERVLDPIRRATPGLRVVMEHITTKDGVDYVMENETGLGATITTHHLVINRNHILAGGIRPHYYCLPVAKREEHRLALRRAATSGDPRFFLGTDSAPHTDALKETACGCAGCFTAPNTLSILAHVFEEDGALDRLEGFSSRHGPAFYGLPASTDTITLEKSETPVACPDRIETGDGPVTVFDPQFPLYWRVL